MTDVKLVRVVHLMLLVYAAGAVGQATFVGVQSGWKQPVLVLLMLLNFAEIMQSALFIADDTVEPKSLWRALWYIPGCGHLLLLPLFIPTLTSLMGAMEESWPLHLASHGWRPSRKQLALSWVVGLALSATSAAVLLKVTPEKREVMDTDIYVFEADHPGLRALQVRGVVGILAMQWTVLGWKPLVWCTAARWCHATHCDALSAYFFWSHTSFLHELGHTDELWGLPFALRASPGAPDTAAILLYRGGRDRSGALVASLGPIHGVVAVFCDEYPQRARFPLCHLLGGGGIPLCGYYVGARGDVRARWGRGETAAS
jgi:hypothetical protein